MGYCGSNISPDENRKLSNLDPQCQVAVGAVIYENNDEQIVGVARFGRANSDDHIAEAGVIVCDDFQDIGLETHLLYQLAEVARSMDVTSFSAWILSENRKILHILRKVGQPTKRTMKLRRDICRDFIGGCKNIEQMLRLFV